MSRRDFKAWTTRVKTCRRSETDETVDEALFETDEELGKTLLAYYNATGKRFWCLSPRSLSVVKLADTAGQKSTDDSDSVYRAVMDCLLLKRSAQTPIETPDGQTRYPRDKMPGLTVRVVELGYADPNVATAVSTTVTELLRSLYTIRAANDSAEVIANPEMGDGGESNNAQSSDSDGAINMTILRGLWMVSMDYKSYQLMQHDDRTTMTREDLLINGIVSAVKSGTIDERQSFKDKAAGGTGTPNLGAEHAEYLRNRDMDGGLSYLFAMLAQDPSVAIPSDRNGMAHFVMYDSPVLHYTVERVHKHRLDGHRTLIAVLNPWFQQ